MYDVIVVWLLFQSDFFHAVRKGCIYTSSVVPGNQMRFISIPASTHDAYVKPSCVNKISSKNVKKHIAYKTQMVAWDAGACVSSTLYMIQIEQS